MTKRFLLAALVALAAAMPMSAEIVTKKFDFTPADGVQRTDFEWNGIAVNQITWDLGSTLKPLRLSTASAVVRLDNNSNVNHVVGVALAVFDEQGNMLAAGSGGNKLGHLNKGERDTFQIRFPYVYRNLKDAKTFLLTLETRDLSWKEQQKKETPAP
jgi:hypothetical protein